MSLFDHAAVERALRMYRLLIPRTALAGRVGGITGTRAGGSLELHDFREYQPGDDIRQLDWNAVARTGQLIVRVRREEVSPRVEVVVDASRAMAITPEKSARALELATLLVRLAQLQGLDPTLIVVRAEPERLRLPNPESIQRIEFGGTVPLGESLRRSRVLQACGIRLIISDFLFETPLDDLCIRLSQKAGFVALVQVMDTSDVAPEVAAGATLIDCETDDRLDRILNRRVIDAYKRRLAAHQALLVASARRASAQWCQGLAQDPLETVLRQRLLGPVLEVRS
jgi:uncharacterized protein (DUF58 family)